MSEMNPYSLMQAMGVKWGNCQLPAGVLGHAHCDNYQKIICVRDFDDEETIIHELAHHDAGLENGHNDKFMKSWSDLIDICDAYKYRKQAA